MIDIIAQLTRDDVNLPNKIDPGPGITLEGNIGNALKLVFAAAGAVAFLLITIAGFKYVMSQGNPQETAKAKGAIIDAIIGLIIAVTAFSIVSFFLGEIG